jgi:hypothetical protein
MGKPIRVQVPAWAPIHFSLTDAPLALRERQRRILDVPWLMPFWRIGPLQIPTTAPFGRDERRVGWA